MPGERAFDVAAARRALRGRIVAEIFGRLLEDQRGTADRWSRGRNRAHARFRRRRRGGGGFSEPARASTLPSRSMTQMRAVVRDRPCMICAISGDADGGSDTPDRCASFVGALARERRDRVGRSRKQSRPVVQRGRHGLRGARQRALLRVAQDALELAHVFDPSHGSARNTSARAGAARGCESAMRGNQLRAARSGDRQRGPSAAAAAR